MRLGSRHFYSSHFHYMCQYVPCLVTRQQASVLLNVLTIRSREHCQAGTIRYRLPRQLNHFLDRHPALDTFANSYLTIIRFEVLLNLTLHLYDHRYQCCFSYVIKLITQVTMSLLYHSVCF